VLCVVTLAVGCGNDHPAPLDAGPEDAGPRDAAPPPACPADPWPAAIEALEDAVKRELDARRAVGGLCDAMFYRATDALADDPALRRAARCHAYDMMTRDLVDARGADGSLVAERAAREGYAGTTTGQAFGFVRPDATAAAIVDGALSGAATCRSLLDPTATDVGVGIAPTDVASGTGARRYFQVTLGH